MKLLNKASVYLLFCLPFHGLGMGFSFQDIQLLPIAHSDVFLLLFWQAFLISLSIF